MNRILKSGLFFMLLIGMMSVSCKKEYDVPPITQVPFGDTLTIDQILGMASGTTFDTASVCGIVTADEQSGNLYKVLFIQDRVSGKAIELKLSSSSAARIGDSVRVCLDPSIMYKPYYGLPQLIDANDKGIDPDGHLIIYPYNKPIEPKTVTITDIMSGAYVAALVKLENAEFRLKNAPFCEIGETTNRVVDDSTFTNSTDDPKYAEFVVRTSNYANFAYDYMPVSKGSMVGIVSVYASSSRTTQQFLIRSKSEMNFAEWGHPTTPVAPGEVQSLPYIQSFASGFGTYMSYSVIDDYHFWTYESSYSIVQMTGHVGGNPGENYANEDWLISSPVAITDVTDAKMTMTYLGRYFDNINNDVTIWVSNNYTYGESPATAQWTQLPATLSESSSWSDFKTVELALTEFVGQTINVAVKYLSTDTKGGTIEVSSIIVEEGTAGDNPGPGPGNVEGDGSRENPYTANDVLAMNIMDSDGNNYWVKGYVVGAVQSFNFTFSDVVTEASNIIIASDQNANTEDACVTVQLPYGPVREGVNLRDNAATVYKQEVLLYGTLEMYFSNHAGVKNVSYAEINGNGFGTDPNGETPPNPGTTEYFNQTLTTQASFNTFSAYSVAGDQEWYQNSSHLDYGAVMSGYANNTSYANEDWFISPVIDLSGSTNPILNFEHARGPQDSMNVGVEEGYYTVWVTNDYPDGADPSQERWVELTILNQPTVKWQFVSAGDLVIPAEFKTSTCRIAFRYLSVDGASATWEIKNVVVKEQ